MFFGFVAFLLLVFARLFGLLVVAFAFVSFAFMCFCFCYVCCLYCLFPPRPPLQLLPARQILQRLPGNYTAVVTLAVDVDGVPTTLYINTYRKSRQNPPTAVNQ